MRCFTGMLPLLLALGCARSTVLDEGDVAGVRDLDPLPLQAMVSVGVAPGAEVSSDEHAAVWTQRLAQALREINAFAVVQALDESGGSSEDNDILIKVSMTPLPGDPVSEAETETSLAVLNGFLWFAAGVPAWFIADKTYPEFFSVSIDIQRPGLGRESLPALSFSTSKPSVNFWDRSTTSQFLLQIIVPPPLVGEDPETLLESLELQSLDEVYLKTARYAKSELPVREAQDAPAFLYQPPGNEGVVVLAQDNLRRISVQGELPAGARRVGMLRFIEEHRIQGEGERDLQFRRIHKYLDDLAKGAPEVQPPTPERLRETFQRVYWFEMEALADEEAQRPLRLEVEIEPEGESIRWTLRNQDPATSGAGGSAPLALAGEGPDETVAE